MKTKNYLWPISLGILMASNSVVSAAAILVTTSDGKIWEYDSVTDMGAQTSSTTSGTLVATHAAYGTDLGSTMDLSTGKVYRITGTGDVVEYAGLSGFLANSGAVTVASAVYTGNYALNGFSYDGNTGGFYGTLPNGQAPAGDNGDVRSWASIADVITNSGSDTAAPYGGNLFNFYDPDGTAVTAALSTGAYTAGDPFTAQYYQSAGNGRLEGFETIALYASSPNNRSELTGLDVFGGNTTAWGTGVDAVAAFAVPEPSVTLLGGLGLLALLRRRR